MQISVSDLFIGFLSHTWDGLFQALFFQLSRQTDSEMYCYVSLSMTDILIQKRNNFMR